ncbi:MAG TPA: 30S ribosomal protein S17e [archaeon]|nr:30S ribosomal protein S17e [archaeon]
MGTVKTSAVKHLAEDLIREYGDRFNADFEHNKQTLNEIKHIKSKKIRNSLAGYIASKMQQIKKSGI